MKQSICLLDNRVGVISSFPKSEPTQLINIIRLHSVLFQHNITMNDFDTQSSWSKKCIGYEVINGSSRNSTKYSAIFKVCSELFNDQKEEKRELMNKEKNSGLIDIVNFNDIPFIHFVVWKHHKKIKDVIECFWRDRSYLCKSDFTCVAGRGNTYMDPSEWEIATLSYSESDDVFSHAIAQIALELDKTYDPSKTNNGDPVVNWDSSCPRRNISKEVWIQKHPYFAHVNYNPNGFIFLPTNKVKSLSPHHKKIYEAFIHNSVTVAQNTKWRIELVSGLRQQQQQFTQFNFDTSYFGQLEEWSLAEMLYFSVCPPRPKFVNAPVILFQSVNQEIHKTIHFQLRNYILYIKEKERTGKDSKIIMCIKKQFSNYFECSTLTNNVIIDNEWDMIVGKGSIFTLLTSISEKHLIPISSLFYPPVVNRSEYLRIMMMHEGNIVASNHNNNQNNNQNQNRLF